MLFLGTLFLPLSFGGSLVPAAQPYPKIIKPKRLERYYVIGDLFFVLGY